MARLSFLVAIALALSACGNQAAVEPMATAGPVGVAKATAAAVHADVGQSTGAPDQAIAVVPPSTEALLDIAKGKGMSCLESPATGTQGVTWACQDAGPDLQFILRADAVDRSRAEQFMLTSFGDKDIPPATLNTTAFDAFSPFASAVDGEALALWLLQNMGVDTTDEPDAPDSTTSMAGVTCTTSVFDTDAGPARTFGTDWRQATPTP